MARIKEHPVTQILNLIESLSTDEKRIIYDRVRPAPKPRQKGKGSGKSAQKRKVDKPESSKCQAAGCELPHEADRHRNKQHPDFHQFQPAGEASKGVGA